MPGPRLRTLYDLVEIKNGKARVLYVDEFVKMKTKMNSFERNKPKNKYMLLVSPEQTLKYLRDTNKAAREHKWIERDINALT